MVDGDGDVDVDGWNSTFRATGSRVPAKGKRWRQGQLQQLQRQRQQQVEELTVDRFDSLERRPLESFIYDDQPRLQQQQQQLQRQQSSTVR